MKVVVEYRDGESKTFDDSRSAMVWVRQHPSPVDTTFWGAGHLLAVQRPNGTIDFKSLTFMANTIRFLLPEEAE